MGAGWDGLDERVGCESKRTTMDGQRDSGTGMCCIESSLTVSLSVRHTRFSVFQAGWYVLVCCCCTTHKPSLLQSATSTARCLRHLVHLIAAVEISG